MISSMPNQQNPIFQNESSKDGDIIPEQYAHTERLASIGRFASKVAHELNNPLDGILRYLNLALRSIDQEEFEKPKEYLIQCREGLMRMVQIVSELLEYSRSNYALSEEPVSLEQIIQDSIKTMQAKEEKSNVEITCNFSAELPKIRGGNLFQVFCNLIKNAIDSMPDGGELTITTGLKPQQSVTIEFRDTGAGFDPKDAKALFEPFFTTKEKGKGTGLGLAICKDIIERYQGHITAENAPEGGSIFTVYLPLTADSFLKV